MKDNTINHKGYTATWKTFKDSVNYSIENFEGRVVDHGDISIHKEVDSELKSIINSLIENETIKCYNIKETRGYYYSLVVTYNSDREVVIHDNLRMDQVEPLRKMVTSANKGLLLDKFSKSVIDMSITKERVFDRALISINSQDTGLAHKFLQLISEMVHEKRK